MKPHKRYEDRAPLNSYQREIAALLRRDIEACSRIWIPGGSPRQEQAVLNLIRYVDCCIVANASQRTNYYVA